MVPSEAPLVWTDRHWTRTILAPLESTAASS